MKVIMYMAISANGAIAQTNDDTSWISTEEWNSYSQAVQEAGTLIVGRRTYEILTKQPEFSELAAVTVVVVSRGNVPLVTDNHLLAHSPTEALSLVKTDSVIVAGGGILNAAFLEQDLADEIRLDIEPILIGNGLPVIAKADPTKNLELLGSKPIGKNGIQLHYAIRKD